MARKKAEPQGPQKSQALALRDMNQYLVDRSDKIAEWCKETGLQPATLRRLAVREAMKPDSKLAQCRPDSIFLALCDAAQLGLEPSGLGGEAYLVPFWDKHTRSFLATLMPGYRGLAKLARRHSDVLDIWAYVVRVEDDFDVELGTDPKIVHRPRHCENPEDPASVRAAYAVAKIRDSSPHFEVLWRPEIDRIRKCSKKADSGPWLYFYDEQARKSAIRRLSKHLPRQRILEAAIAATDALDLGDYNGYRRAVEAAQDSEPDFDDVPEPEQKGARAVMDAIEIREAKGESAAAENVETFCKGCGGPIEAGQLFCEACAGEDQPDWAKE